MTGIRVTMYQGVLSKPTYLDHGYEYYFRLLALRKVYGAIIEAGLSRKLEGS